MMRTFMKRMGGLFLTLFLLMSGMARASADILGLDASLSSWLQRESTLRFSVSMELQTFLPFPEEQVTMMNQLLKHLSFQSSLERDGQDSLTMLALSCDEDALFSLSERETNGAFTLETSLLPKRVLQSQGISPIDSLSGSDTAQVPETSFDMLAAIPEVEGCYLALIDACEPFAEKKKASYKIKDIGTAKWSQIARLTTEQSDEMLPLLRAVLKSGMDEAHRAELDQVRFAKGFIVALYKLGENDKDIALYMKGDLIYPDSSIKKLSFQWAFLNNGTARKDSYKYELAKSGGSAESRIVAALCSQELFSDQVSIQNTSSLTTKVDGETTTQTEKISLSGKMTDASRTLSGSVSQLVKVTKGDKTASSTMTLTPDLTLTATDDNAVLSGNVQLESKAEKATSLAMLFTFASDIPDSFTASTKENGLYAVVGDVEAETGADSPPISFMQNMEEDPLIEPETGNASPASSGAETQANSDFLVGSGPIGMQSHSIPDETTTISLNSISEAWHAALLDELSQNLAAKLLTAFMKLPAEDLALLADGMTDTDYKSFLSLFAN